MPRFATGVVAQVLAEREGVVRLIVRVGDAERPATAFTKAIGPVAEGDRVVVNTTAVDLDLTLRGKGLIDLTITCGHAFGGDLETVNVFSGLAAARHVGGAAVAVVAMGPGIVGTETVLGHTGMEQGQTLSATASLGGLPIAPLRISFAEP